MTPMRLHSEIRPVGGISAQERDAMYLLMTKYYERVTRERFEHDLAQKKDVILLTGPDLALKGFSTVMFFDVPVGPPGQLAASQAGSPQACSPAKARFTDQKQVPSKVPSDRSGIVRALFSGDTIVDRTCWGEQDLATQWGNYALKAADEYQPLYWFLISKGYKTYRFLPVFFNEFYPRYDAPTPAAMQQVLDAFCDAKFKDQYLRERGILHFDDMKDRLKDGVADIEPQQLKNPHIRYFADRNPGWRAGDELPCIAPLVRENFNETALRVLGRMGGPA